ncbi:hypothetical protein [Paenibacillus sp. TAF43_2]|uniref:hypothetical protein n=1 Tax=Paenibacillus sp. TAF43_2 TaxID=3233069 RepID=UPI003F9AFEED
MYKQQILEPVIKITQKSLDDNDFNLILEKIDITIELLEKISSFDASVGILWNELASDVISSIYSATSGFYRQAILSLRSVLELGCSSLFYLDHKIEYEMFIKFNAKADKYVSTLVNDYSFFTTKYVATFYEQIHNLQSTTDSVSAYLKAIYGDLSDIVHGRYHTLTKKQGLQIKYDKRQFKSYEGFLNRVLNILCMMYVLRFKDSSNAEIVKLAQSTGTVSI